MSPAEEKIANDVCVQEKWTLHAPSLPSAIIFNLKTKIRLLLEGATAFFFSNVDLFYN